MAELFYKGEDILLTIDIFNDENMREKVLIDDVTTEMILYTKDDGMIIEASSSGDKDLTIITEDNITQSLLIPSDVSSELETGELTIEMRIVDEDGSTRIDVVNPGITICQSKIGEL